MFDRVAIVGVGLMGASIGLAWKARFPASYVLGISRSDVTLDTAIQRGAIDTGLREIGPELRSADFLVVATPVDRIAETVAQARQQLSKSALMTDVGSTKGAIVSAVRAQPGHVEFVGSHPLAGSHKSGPMAASADLFVDRVCVLTPTSETTPEALDKVRKFWQILGMRVLSMPAEEHDAIVARTSHLPHLAAFALARSVTPSDLKLAASGFRDTTRLAASRAEIWTAIFRDNRDAVLNAVDRYLAEIAKLKDAIESGDEALMENLLTDAKRIRDTLGD